MKKVETEERKRNEKLGGDRGEGDIREKLSNS